MRKISKDYLAFHKFLETTHYSISYNVILGPSLTTQFFVISDRKFRTENKKVPFPGNVQNS